MSPNGGVANVMVWLRPPLGQSFPITRAVRDERPGAWPREVVLDWPNLVFRPHVAVLFQSYAAPGRQKRLPTGQVFRACNNSTVTTNLVWHGQAEGMGNLLFPVDKEQVIELPPQRMPVAFTSSIHPHMRAFVLSLDHPYAAISDQNGCFEIRNIPFGIPARLMAWHEATGYLTGRAGMNLDLANGANWQELRLRLRP